jgi:dTMP kinase
MSQQRKKTRGFLITFEGTDGSGKSTLIQKVSAALTAQGDRVLTTREPGGSPVAEDIRKVLLSHTAHPMDPWTEVFLYEAARAEHLAQTIRPALLTQDWILCDRFTDSTLAYQAGARDLPWKDVRILNRLATRGLKPDLTVFLDTPPEIALARAQDPNRFEAEGLGFQKKVREGYLKARSLHPGRWLTLQPGTPEALAERVLKTLQKRCR